jgi:hypothetical protein
MVQVIIYRFVYTLLFQRECTGQAF